MQCNALYILVLAVAACSAATCASAQQGSQRKEVCLSNIKQIGVGVLMYVFDHDDKFALKSACFKKSILPYIKDSSVFHCSSDDSGIVSYSFNVRLAGMKPERLRSPARIVMVYEGKDGMLDFKHDGKAAVCYADDHAKMISEAEAKALRWVP